MRRAAPALPLWLGLSGLLPFWLLAIARVAGLGFGFTPGGLALALAAYAATILSFLGGIRWGLTLARDEGGIDRFDYVWSVVPQLLGWASLALPDPWRLFILAGLVLAMGPLDRDMVRRGLAPAWFGRLRVTLSVGAGAALLLSALA